MRDELIYRRRGEDLERVAVTAVDTQFGDYNVELTVDDSGDVLRVSISAALEPLGDRAVLDGPPVTSTTLRALPLARMVRHSIAMRTVHPAQGRPEWLRRLTLLMVREERGSMTDSDYALVAAGYDAQIRAGSAKPLDDLVAEVPGLSYGNARNYVRTARKRGLLTPTQRGRAGGTITRKAIELLEENA